MKPLEMIAEWRKGCTCGGPLLGKIEGAPRGTHSPAECVECTEGLINALEEVLHEPNADMFGPDPVNPLYDNLDYRLKENEFHPALREIWRRMAGSET